MMSGYETIDEENDRLRAEVRGCVERKRHLYGGYVFAIQALRTPTLDIEAAVAALMHAIGPTGADRKPGTVPAGMRVRLTSASCWPGAIGAVIAPTSCSTSL